MNLKTLLILPLLGTSALFATNHQITISGTNYSPSLLVVQINDVVNIEASSTHPLVQVSKATWDASLNTELAGGWGTKTASYQFTITTTDTIYFVCQQHASIGMKGRIVVDAVNGMKKTTIAKNYLFTNPSKGQEIQFNNNNGISLKIEIFNSGGSLVKSVSAEPGLNKINLSSGIYFMRISSAEAILGRETAIVE